jgi:hypothetical protein
MKRPSDLKADIEKIKKLKALQQKALDKLDKISEKAAGTKSTKKTARKYKAKTPRKKSFWQRLFGGDAGMRS